MLVTTLIIAISSEELVHLNICGLVYPNASMYVCKYQQKGWK